jgi:hypothetical protein
MNEGRNIQPNHLGAGLWAVRSRLRFRDWRGGSNLPCRERLAVNQERRETLRGVLTYGIGVAVLTCFIVAIGGCQL